MSDNIYDRLKKIENSINELDRLARHVGELRAEAGARAVKESIASGSTTDTLRGTNFSAADRLALLKMAAEATRDAHNLAAVEGTFKRLASIVRAR